MRNFTIDRGGAMTAEKIKEYINAFTTECLPAFIKRKAYFDGEHKILRKRFENSDKQPSRIVCNFVKSIVESYSGYAVGISPRIESGADDEALQNVLNYNDSDEQIVNFFTDGLIYGRACILNYIDSDSKCRFSVVSPEQIIPVYSSDLEAVLLYVIRFWKIQGTGVNEDKYYIEVYDNAFRTLYEASSGFNSFTMIEAPVPHNFDQVPAVIFSLNRDEVGVCDDSVFTLNDMYNELLSDANDNENAFADAMLVLKGTFADEEDVESMKVNKVLMLDTDAGADYLVKDVKGTQSEQLLDRVEKKIREHTGCPDFGSDEFKSSSGVAIRYRLLAMENLTSAALNRFKKALQKLVELIAGVEELKMGEADWRDVKIIFVRNLPIDETANAQVVAQLSGMVSRETLLGLLPFVDNPAEEVKKAEAENSARFELYSQPMTDEGNGDGEQ